MIIFLDIEATGSDIDLDDILEIAAVAVDDDLREVDHFHAVLPYTLNNVRARCFTTRVDGVVLKMHSENGLWDECQTLHDLGSGLWCLDPEPPNTCGWGGEQDLRAFFNCHPGAWLAGRAVSSYDRPFLEHHFPRCTEALSHRSIDMRTLWRLGELVPGLWEGAGIPATNTAHRAMGDVRGDLEALRAMRRKLTLLQDRWA